MADYSLGNLTIELVAETTKATASIKKTVEALETMSVALQTLTASFDSFTSSLSKSITGTSSIFTQLNKSISPFLESLENSSKGLTSFTRFLSTSFSPDNFSGASQVFTQLTSDITPFIDKVKEAEQALVALSQVMKSKGGSDGDSSKGGLGNLEKNLKIATIFVALKKIWQTLKKIRDAYMKILKAGIDYTEVLNLWQVSMRDNVDMAQEFVLKMSRAYGMSEKTLMNTQAIYKNMIGALGNVSESTAYELSESLVKMTLDFASLYNLPLQEATNKFQAMLARQVRPIRSVSGYDITERTIYGLYESLGGKKTMRQLNNTEKQLLSILAVFKQMEKTGALADYQKMIDQSAVQMKMIEENWEQVLSYVGLVAKMLLDQAGILTKLNALLITAGEIARAIAISMGYKKEDFLTSMFEGIEEGADDASESVEDLKNKLLGFDRFRVLGEQLGVSDDDVVIDEVVLNALKEYNSLMDDFKNTSREMAEDWLISLGFIQNLNGVLDISEGNLQKIKNTLIAVGIAGAVAFGAILFAINPLIFVITVIIVGITLLVVAIKKLIDGKIETGLWLITGAVVALGIAIALLTGSFLPLMIAGIIAVGTTVGALVAGYGRRQDVYSSRKMADGGIPDRGTLFWAGEAGAEVVANKGGGSSTGVMNMAQMEGAVAKGMMSALMSYGSKGGETIEVTIDGDTVFSAVRNNARRRGIKALG